MTLVEAVTVLAKTLRCVASTHAVDGLTYQGTRVLRECICRWVVDKSRMCSWIGSSLHWTPSAMSNRKTGPSGSLLFFFSIYRTTKRDVTSEFVETYPACAEPEVCLSKIWRYKPLLFAIVIILLLVRTSVSLNEGLPIKMTRELFQRKRYFFYEKDRRFNPRLIHKSSFLIGQVPIEQLKNTGWKLCFCYSTYRK